MQKLQSARTNLWVIYRTQIVNFKVTILKITFHIVTFMPTIFHMDNLRKFYEALNSAKAI